jgi:hypothetical protein
MSCAGQLADGVVLSAFMPTTYVERARARLDKAAEGTFAGEVGGALVVSLADSLAAAAARVRPILATYLVFFPNLAMETGLDPGFLDRLRARARADGLASIYEELPDDLVRVLGQAVDGQLELMGEGVGAGGAVERPEHDHPSVLGRHHRLEAGPVRRLLGHAEQRPQAAAGPRRGRRGPRPRPTQARRGAASGRGRAASCWSSC